MTYGQITDRIEEILANREGRKPRRALIYDGSPEREWGRWRVERAYKARERILSAKYELPVRPWRPDPRESDS